MSGQAFCAAALLRTFLGFVSGQSSIWTGDAETEMARAKKVMAIEDLMLMEWFMEDTGSNGCFCMLESETAC